MVIHLELRKRWMFVPIAKCNKQQLEYVRGKRIQIIIFIIEIKIQA